ncbi:SCO family protein [Baekduia soli]|uniref:SCO family protein n=1 Tax=Baekduia soli TaxID=496014 RepID=UPI0016529DFD|nr:SCO family protein [Baekduia soli]
MSRIERIGRALLAVGAVLVVADVVAFLGLGVGRGTKQAGAVPTSSLAEGVAVDRPVGSLGLRDERGRPTSLAAFRGRYLVIAPSLTLCREVCPLTTGALEGLRRRLQDDGLGDRVVVAEATVDPWRDSPARVRAWKRRTGATIRYLTGSPAQIHRLWSALGIAYRRTPEGVPADTDSWTHRPLRFDVQHSDGVFVVDPRGRLRVAITGMPRVGVLPKRLTAMLDATGRENLLHPRAPWTVEGLYADLLAVMGRPAAPGAGAGAAPTAAEARAALTGSPAPLAALHAQGGRLLDGGTAAFRARLAALRGRPVVVNAWASWCPPCRTELPLLAGAAARFGRQVAFLGLDVNDQAAAGRRLLAAAQPSYPSYAGASGAAGSGLPGFFGLPTTFFLDRAGRVIATHQGEYRDRATLDADIRRHLLAGIGSG